MFLLFESLKPEDAAYEKEVGRRYSATQKFALLEECLQHISWQLPDCLCKLLEFRLLSHKNRGAALV